MNKDRLDKYAELAIKVGVNVKPGETLVIRSPIECAEFVRLAVKHAYDCGAKHVHVEYNDERVKLLKFLYAPDEVFDEYPKWTAQMYTDIAKEKGAFLTVYAEDPDLMKDVDPDRIARYQRAQGGPLKEWRSLMMGDKCKWNIVSVPTEAWAQKVYPDLKPEEAVERLWDDILYCCRVNEDPIKEWEEHNAELERRRKYLNDCEFKELRYKSSKTDLTLRLPDNHVWLSGAATDTLGNPFNPNIPTEEIYCAPLKTGVDGIVYSTKPLVFGGNVIDNFYLKLKDGKIVEFDAEKGKDTLKRIIATDEGSCYLGEVALVPYNSPISMINTVFYNTLFDENASCHLAIGAAYSTCVKDTDGLSEKELEDKGLNYSIVHEDFMIGSEDLSIIGITKDGKEVEVFVNGNWADMK